MKSKYWNILTLSVIVVLSAICLRLLLVETTLKYGMILLGALALAYLIWKAFIKSGRDELKRSEKRTGELESEIGALKKTISELDRELKEKNDSRLSIVGISPILHVAVLDVDTSFVRTFVREEDGMKFNGALRADICAEYGIRLEDVRFRYDSASNKLFLANFAPGLISYSKKQLSWDIAQSWHSVSLLGHEFPPIGDSPSERFTKRMSEQLRAEVEKEIDERKIEELDWLSPMVTRQVTDLLKLTMGKPDAQVIIAEGADVDEQDSGYVDFATFCRELKAPESAGLLTD